MKKNKNSKKNQRKLLDNKLNIRPETKDDYSQITEVNDLAFGQKNEGILIKKLRQSGKFIPELSLVAELNKKIIGHILFYPITIHSPETKFFSLALAPMAVTPTYQRLGIGSRLVFEGLRTAKRLGHKSVIVLGHPEYYPKFEFKRASEWNIKAPFEVPDEAFMALELVKDELKGRSGTVEYPEEFNEV